jgi:ADP-ribose pyrophosphatase YjhB (NUDIX family)
MDSAGSLDSPTAAERVRRVAIQLAALAQNGLTYSLNDYDSSRYGSAAELARELVSVLAGPDADLSLLLAQDSGYSTPKVDVRGVLIDSEERFLLMRERSDGLWSLPGGWADPLDTPSTAVVREVREETGHVAQVIKLIGCWDRDARGHVPPLAVAAYKLFFLCRSTGSGPFEALETLEIGWFGIDELPELSLGRINRWELERALAHHREPTLPTEFD